eukprot:scaffold16606_cov84-Isochrysis_galbana.AAC.2
MSELLEGGLWDKGGDHSPAVKLLAVQLLAAGQGGVGGGEVGKDLEGDGTGLDRRARGARRARLGRQKGA